MNNSRVSAYQSFCIQREKDLNRIASHSRGGHDLEDVKNEAWMMAEEMYRTKAIAIDWLNREDQDLLLSYLYQDLVRYTERHFQYAVRLDHWSSEDGSDEPHPLQNRLVADNGADPLALLSAREEALQAELNEADCHHSLASAYIHLLRHFDNKISAVANHLLISRSYCYRRYARVRLLAERQRPIPIHRTAKQDRFIPGAWRKFRLRRTPVQLAFDFGPDDSLLPMAV